MQLYAKEVELLSTYNATPALDRKQMFEIFNEAFHYPETSRVALFYNCAVYKTVPGLAELAALEANKIIDQLGLPLFIVLTAYPTKDSFTIQELVRERAI